MKWTHSDKLLKKTTACTFNKRLRFPPLTPNKIIRSENTTKSSSWSLLVLLNHVVVDLILPSPLNILTTQFPPALPDTTCYWAKAHLKKKTKNTRPGHWRSRGPRLADFETRGEYEILRVQSNPTVPGGKRAHLVLPRLLDRDPESWFKPFGTDTPWATLLGAKRKRN